MNNLNNISVGRKRFPVSSKIKKHKNKSNLKLKIN